MNKFLIKFVGILAALVMAVTGFSIAPASADTQECFGRATDPGGIDDCVSFSIDGGKQADGTGYYFDDATIKCSGRLENDPAFNGYSIVVESWSRDWHLLNQWTVNDNPNVYQDAGAFDCNSRTFGTSVDRLKGPYLNVVVRGNLRRDNADDKSIYLAHWVNGAVPPL